MAYYCEPSDTHVSFTWQRDGNERNFRDTSDARGYFNFQDIFLRLNRFRVQARPSLTCAI